MSKKHFVIIREKKVEVIGNIRINANKYNQLANSNYFRINKCTSNVQNYSLYSDKALIKNLTVNLYLVPPDLFDKILEAVKKYLLD